MEGPDLYTFDRQFGVCVCGIDEAGRGPLAGAVYAACAVLRPGTEIPYLNDSKKLTEKRRELVYQRLLDGGAWYGVGTASPEEIDRVNILNATYLAMNRAYAAMMARGDLPAELFPPKLALVDGNRDPSLPVSTLLVVKGDAKSASIAAASVLAKVSRDRYMLELDRQYPQYQFAKHKGYPTKLHYELLEEYGISPVHRRSFLKNLVGTV